MNDAGQAQRKGLRAQISHAEARIRWASVTLISRRLDGHTGSPSSRRVPRRVKIEGLPLPFADPSIDAAPNGKQVPRLAS
ncbi:hypothetical protein HEP87_07840 [Streptomyces sp. S1D4-11]|nr:hypothetical protein [Streptomyces sp. S1D4-11]QIY93990.1 hypothetical protein HEP87_07840 [Streptomyces sp. S1D4-11]